MALTSPLPRLRNSAARARFDRKLVDDGLAKHVIEMGPLPNSARRPDNPRLGIAWPKALPGLVWIELYEVPFVLGAASRETSREPGGAQTWLPVDREGADRETPLCRFVLGRAADSTRVSWTGKVEYLAAAKDVVVDGAYVDLEVDVFSGDAVGMPDEASDGVIVRGIPLLERAGTAYAAEGATWELGAKLHYEPYSLAQPITREALDEALTRASPGEGEETYYQLPRMRKVAFRMQKDQDAPIELQDRHVLALHHLRVRDAKGLQSAFQYEVLHQTQGRRAKYVPILDVKATTKRSKPPKGHPLRGHPILGKKKPEYVHDLVLEADPKLVGRQEAEEDKVWRLLTTDSMYWLLPDSFRTTGKVRLSELGTPTVVPANPRVSTTVEQVTLHVKGPWATFESDLKEVLQSIELTRRWQRAYEREYRKVREEVEAYTRTVLPIVDGLGDLPVEIGAIAGGKKNVKLRSLASVDGTAATQRKLATLKALADRSSHHVAKALEVWSRPRFQQVFAGTQFLGEGLTVAWGKYTDQVRDGAGKLRTETVEATTYRYDDALKAMIVNASAGNFSLLAEVSQNDATTAEARKQRIATFRKQYAGPIRAMIQAKLDGDGADSTAYFLADKVGPTTFWQSMSGGGLALFLYGTDHDRDLVATLMLGKGQGVTGLASRWDLIHANDETFEAMHKRVAERDGLSVEGAQAVEVLVGLLKVTADWVKLATSDFKADEVKTWIDLSELLLTTVELGLKTVKLIAPMWIGVSETSAAAVAAIDDALGSTLKVVGNLLKVVSALKELYTVYKAIKRLGTDRLKDYKTLIVSVGNLVILAIGLFVPVVGAILGAVFLLIQALLSAFSDSPRAALGVWYGRTPWGDRPHDDDTKDLGWKNHVALFVAACDAMNTYMDELFENIDKEDVQSSLWAYLDQWARAHEKLLGVRVDVKVKLGDEGYVVVHVYSGQGGARLTDD